MATIGTDKKRTMEMEQPLEIGHLRQKKVEEFLPEYDIEEESSLLSMHEKHVMEHQAICLPTAYLGNEKKDSKDIAKGVCDTYFLANFEPANFPRFDYHCDLVKQIGESVYHQNVDNIPELIKNTIVIYGRKTNINKELLHPLQLQEIDKKENVDHVIMIVFTDVTDEEHETLNLIEDEIEKSSRCIIVTSNSEQLRHANRTTLAKSRKCSIVSPHSDAMWSHLTSALELSLIEYLKGLMAFSNDKDDIETVLRRIEKCSDFPEIKKGQKSREIPKDIKAVLERFAKYIVRYGFHFKKFRIIVRQEKYQEVLQATNIASTNYFPEIQVLCDDNFEETVEPYNGVHQAQGMKIFQLSEEPEQGDDLYCTLGSLALLNETDTVALSSRHICESSEFFFIDNIDKKHRQSTIDNRRTLLGKCLYTPSGSPAYYNDMAIIEITDEIKNNLNEKRILNSNGVANKVEIMNLEDLDITGEIVHKFGAATQWTQGKVVCSELIHNEFHFVGVVGMLKKEFAKPGDSGSVIFRQSYDANGHFEVVAMLYGGNKSISLNAQEDPKKLIYCSGFENAFELIKKRYSQVKSISFF